MTKIKQLFNILNNYNPIINPINDRINNYNNCYLFNIYLENIKLLYNKGLTKIYQTTHYIIKEQILIIDAYINNIDSIINEINNHIKLNNNKHIVKLYNILYYNSTEYKNNNLYIYLILEKLNTIKKKFNNNLVKQLLYAIRSIHNQGIIHCDLNKSNIFINNKGILKIGDFDCSTTTNQIIGCHNLYISPEFNKLINSSIYNHNSITKKHDIFSLGILLIQLKYNINIHNLYNHDYNIYYNNLIQSINHINNPFIIKLIDKDYLNRPDINEIIQENYFTNSFCC